MAQQRYQGVRLNGTAFETPNLDSFTIGIGRRPTRNNPNPRPWTLYVRQKGVDFDPKWFDDRERRGGFGEPKPEKGPRLGVFLKGFLNFEFNVDDEIDEDEDANWGPIRPLGAGTYGTVGLWQKRDGQNNIIDEIVCKEMRLYSKATEEGSGFNLFHHILDQSPVEGAAKHLDQIAGKLVTEAAIHRDINVQHPGVAPHLRGFKFLQDHDRGGGRYRLYLEHCPYGNLTHISRLYRCWDTHLPEAFIWHVFYDLVKGCDALRGPPPEDSKMLLWPKQNKDYQNARERLYCLHLDMKPANFLLGYPHEGDEYPSALTNDFGMSAYTSYEGEGPKPNPAELSWRGTQSYVTPEQSRYGSKWNLPPDEAWLQSDAANLARIDRYKAVSRLRKKREILEPSVNIHGIGQTMFDLITLTPTSGHLHNLRANSLEEYQLNGNHQIKESDISTTPLDFYSAQLRRLVHRCLDPTPAKRPTQLELLYLTRRGLRMSIKRAGQLPKLYFRDNEINDMERGNAAFKPDEVDFRELIQSQFVNPDLPALKLPPAKFGHLSHGWEGRPAWKKYYRHVNSHRRWFQPIGADYSREVSPSESNDTDFHDYKPDDGGDAEDTENPSVSSDPDSSENGHDGNRNRAPSKKEQTKRAMALRARILQDGGRLISEERSKKVLRNSAWDVTGALDNYRRKLNRARNRAEQRNRQALRPGGYLPTSTFLALDYDEQQNRIDDLARRLHPIVVNEAELRRYLKGARGGDVAAAEGDIRRAHDLAELRKLVQTPSPAQSGEEWLFSDVWLRGYLTRAAQDIRAAERSWRQDFKRYFSEEANYAGESRAEKGRIDNLRELVQHLVINRAPRYPWITNRGLRNFIRDAGGDCGEAERLWRDRYNRLYGTNASEAPDARNSFSSGAENHLDGSPSPLPGTNTRSKGVSRDSGKASWTGMSGSGVGRKAKSPSKPGSRPAGITKARTPVRQGKEKGKGKVAQQQQLAQATDAQHPPQRRSTRIAKQAKK